MSSLCGDSPLLHQCRPTRGPQFGDRQLVDALRRTRRGKYRLGIEADHEPLELEHLVAAVGVRRVPRSRSRAASRRSALAIDRHPAVPRHVDGRRRPGCAIGHEHAVPAAARRRARPARTARGWGSRRRRRASAPRPRRADATTLNAISRNAWLLSGTDDQARRRRWPPTPRTDTSPTGRSSRARLMPHACMATNSRSADSRANATSRPTSSDIGIVSASADGTSMQHRRRRRRAGRRPWR